MTWDYYDDKIEKRIRDNREIDTFGGSDPSDETEEERQITEFVNNLSEMNRKIKLEIFKFRKLLKKAGKNSLFNNFNDRELRNLETGKDDTISKLIEKINDMGYPADYTR